MSVQAVAVITPAPGKEARVKELLIELANKVEANEKGVAQYQLFEQYNGEGGNVFIVEETYNSKEDGEAHAKTDYFLALAEVVTKEELFGKPLDVKYIKPIAGFASR